jgi:21S rRNA (uridine2791-2'-O)-methyltransferase
MTRSLRPLAIQLQAQSQLYLASNYVPQPPSSPIQTRPSSSASSARWKTRQTSDPYTKSSKLTALKSRAAYKLLEINDKHKLFRAGQSVVDLGYAPGSWSQVAKNRVGESGRVVGIDIIPAQPPRGVSALQGDFLSAGVQGLVRDFVREWKSGEAEETVGEDEELRSVVERARGNVVAVGEGEGTGTATTIGEAETEVPSPVVEKKTPKKAKKLSSAALDLQQGRVVDVVLSDMCAPFPGLELSSWVNSVNRPYRRMMNTSGNPFRDHAGSIVRHAGLGARESSDGDADKLCFRIYAWQH